MMQKAQQKPEVYRGVSGKIGLQGGIGENRAGDIFPASLPNAVGPDMSELAYAPPRRVHMLSLV